MRGRNGLRGRKSAERIHPSTWRCAASIWQSWTPKGGTEAITNVFFIKACTRSFWKIEPPGQFARDHQTVLQQNGWDHIAQEILISTPRRFGKTTSVSMFCAAMLLACPGVEISIYSTCKRISQTILRNVQKFALMIADDEYASLHFAVKRENMEEINLQGLECSNCPLSDFFFYMQTLLVVHPFECPPSFQCMSLLCKLARTPPARFTPYSLATNIQLECEQPRACLL